MAQIPNIDPSYETLKNPLEPTGGNRPVVGYQAGGPQAAMAGLGAEGEKISNDWKDAQDKINYTYAQSHLMTSAIAAQKTAELNPDPQAAETDFNQSMAQATKEAASMVHNPILSQQITAEAPQHTWRSYNQMMQNNVEKQKNMALDSIQQLGQKNAQAFLATSDPAQQQKLMSNFGDAVDQAYGSGMINATTRSNMKDNYRDNVSSQWLDTLPAEQRQQYLERALPASVTGKVLPTTSADSINYLIDNFEGSDTVQNDGKRGMSKFGINKSANPDVDVANLTRDQAANIYKTRYWDAIGADQLPDNMKMAAFDTAVNFGVPKAKDMLAQAGNDPAKLSELRMEGHQALVKSDPATYGKYAQSWNDRDMTISAQAGFPKTGTLTDFIQPDTLLKKWNQTLPDVQANLHSRMDDSIAMAMSGKDDPSQPLTRQQFQAAFSKSGEGYDIYDKYQDGLTLAHNMYKVGGMTIQQQADVLKSYEPKPGADFADQQKQYATMQKAIQNVNQNMADDPVGFMTQQNTDLNQKLQAAQKDPSKVQDYANSLDAAYDHMGIADHDRPFLPTSMAQGLVQKITTAPPDQVPAMFDQMQQQYGQNLPRVMGDLMREKLPGSYNVMFASSDPTARAALASSTAMGKKAVEGAMLPEAVKGISNDVEANSDLQKLTATFGATGDNGGLGSQVMEATKMTAMGLVLKTSMQPAAAVKQAVDSVTAQYDFADHYRVPKGLLGPAEAASDKVMDNLKPELLRTIANPRNINYSPEELNDATLQSVKNGFWVTNKDETGLERRDSFGAPVIMKDGNRLTIPFSHLRTSPDVSGAQPQREPFDLSGG